MTKGELNDLSVKLSVINDVIAWHKLQIETMKESSVLSKQLSIAGKMSAHNAALAHLGNKKKMLMKLKPKK